MDTPRCDSWRELQTYAQDRESGDLGMRQQPRLMILGLEVEEGG